MVLYFLRPIGLIKNRIVALEAGDLDAKIKIIGEDELAELSHNINNLIKQIKGLLGQKERLLSDVSHEIRTPLSKIRLLLEMKAKEDKKQQINKQIDYLDAMITNILISDKLSVPYSNLDIGPIEVNCLIQQGVDLTKHSNVVVRLPDNPTIYCDVVKLAVVIKNLLDNAEKYAPSSSPVVVSCKTEGEIVFIQVVDSGPGIPEDLMAKIAQPFVRGQNLKKAGFGLGLSICKKVIAAHAGSLLIKNNKKSSGCTINIKLNNKILKNRYLSGKK
jgi:signal transduction histidine kinase